MHRFIVLDSFRGTSAIIVCLFHLPVFYHFYFSAFIQNSFMFVDFFFVLSGFVISYAYRGELTDTSAATRFVIRRFGRLWPLHMAVLIVLIIAQLAAAAIQTLGVSMPKVPFTENWATSAIIDHVLLIQSLGLRDMLTWNQPSWSISAEFWAYVTFASTAMIFHRRMELVSTILIAACIAVLHQFSPRILDATFDYGYFRCIAGFFTGVLVQIHWKPTRLSYKASTFLEVLTLCGVALFVTTTGGSVGSLAAPGVFGMVVYLFASERGAVSVLLKSRPFQSLGCWSYSIYMVHSIYALVLFKNTPRVLESLLHRPLMTTFNHKGEEIALLSVGNAFAMDLVAMLYLILVVATAALSYRLIESPSRRWFYGFSNKIAPSPLENSRGLPGMTAPKEHTWDLTPEPGLERE